MKHMGDTQSLYSAGLQVQLHINKGCAGGCRGGPEWWVLMSSQMGNVKWCFIRGHTWEAYSCSPLAFLGFYLPSSSVAGPKPGEAGTEQGSTSPGLPSTLSLPRGNWSFSSHKEMIHPFHLFCVALVSPEPNSL